MGPHPCAQLQGGRPEYHAFPVGVHRSPGRRRLGSGPTNRRRYSHTRSSSHPRDNPPTMSVSILDIAFAHAKGHSAAAACGSNSANARNAGPASPVRGSCKKNGASVSPTNATPSSTASHGIRPIVHMDSPHTSSRALRTAPTAPHPALVFFHAARAATPRRSVRFSMNREAGACRRHDRDAPANRR